MFRRFALLAACFLLTAGAATSDTLRFGVRLAGVPVGELALAAEANGQAYAAAANFRTTGLAGLLARVNFDMKARGRGAVPNLSARSYAEQLDTGYRSSSASVNFSAGDGRVDPLTALYAAAADRPAAAGCAFETTTYDGERSMRVRVRQGGADDAGLVCSGSITRTGGFTAEEMSHHTGFTFTVRYERRGELLVVTRADVGTIYGKVALVRR